MTSPVALVVVIVDDSTGDMEPTSASNGFNEYICNGYAHNAYITLQQGRF